MSMITNRIKNATHDRIADAQARSADRLWQGTITDSDFHWFEQYKGSRRNGQCLMIECTILNVGDGTDDSAVVALQKWIRVGSQREGSYDEITV